MARGRYAGMRMTVRIIAMPIDMPMSITPD